MNAFAAPFGLSYHGPRQNSKTWVQVTDPPSKILIDGVPVEGVEFIYLGSKQSSNGYCRPDVLRRIELACPVINSLQRYGIAVLSVSAPKYTCAKH